MPKRAVMDGRLMVMLLVNGKRNRHSDMTPCDIQLGPLRQAFSCCAVSHTLPNSVSGTIARAEPIVTADISEPIPFGDQRVGDRIGTGRGDKSRCRASRG